ncbi:RsmB/NOP family class I SAM-dependent RNA methyltransferase [Neisseria wadsworthii]|uniref:RsmB/NOP family methyltransferase n=1 Tax=Neisseria wadsworthii 9715 TaxID=1030841 RepID=G4CTX7_9NEIS|nr:RsmB/NOP family class I SAM-dependent RNA methyltransferase [Neisseria wadsworthii]EGZ43765.1 RsmB/NOP family methyltransferase [Neisseria wadsworthii 9715]QMT34858.1 RsmB/NOP family class I SAM-dependent RNA methyltransferase [Neisseria wadsworthii]
MTPAQLNHTAAVLAEILTFKQPADSILAAYFREHKKLGRQDRYEIAETVFAVLRHYQKISAIVPKPHTKPRQAALAALIIGRAADADLIHHLTEQEEVENLKSLFGNTNPFPSTLHITAELPEWLIEILQKHYDNTAILRFSHSINQPAPLDIRVNTLKSKRDKVLAQLQKEGFAAQATPFSPWGIRLKDKPSLNRHPLFLDGTLEIQDEGSQLLALLLGAKRGEIVVDFCAGAGGKTLAIAAMMANKGRIYAFDIAEKRLANLKPRMARAGVANIHPERISSETDPRIARLYGKADRVLVDAPCSGLGTLRRNPDLKYRQSPETLASLRAQQAAILAEAAKLVNEKGRLVYATCSILPEENEMQVHHFLESHPDWHIVDCASLLSNYKIPLDTGVYLRLNTEQHQTDGFFAAVLERN